MPINPKMIADPENEEQLIPNPDYDPTKDEDGNLIETDQNEDTRTDAEKELDKAKAKFKEKVDAAYAAKATAEARVKELEAAERKRQADKLKEEGNLSEAHAMELADRDSELETLRAENTKLTRDRDVRDAVSDAGVEFRSPKAKTSAVNEIVSDLVRGEDGIWKSKSGESVEVYVKAFLEHTDNSYLLKPKRSSGGGTETPKPGSKTETKKSNSIFDLSMEEITANILAGKPPKG